MLRAHAQTPYMGTNIARVMGHGHDLPDRTCAPDRQEALPRLDAVVPLETGSPPPNAHAVTCTRKLRNRGSRHGSMKPQSDRVRRDQKCRRASCVNEKADACWRPGGDGP